MKFYAILSNYCSQIDYWLEFDFLNAGEKTLNI